MVPTGPVISEKTQNTPILTHLGLLFLSREFLLTLFPIGPRVSEKKIKTDNAHFAALDLLFLLCNSDQQKNINFLRGPSTEHSYQVWFKCAQWFQRMRFKTMPISTHLGILFLLCTSVQQEHNCFDLQINIHAKFGSSWLSSFMKED